MPTAAYRDEGVSYHYAPPGDYLEIPTAQTLLRILTAMGLPCVAGKTWTTDAIYRETRDQFEKRRAEGCVAVEMECASLMAVSQFRNVPVYQFLYAEDNLDAAAWEKRLFGHQSRSNYELYLRIALECALRFQMEQ